MTLNDFNKEEILGLIATELTTIVNDNQELYEGYSFEVSEEQQFMPDERERKKIYIVVKFLPATINFGQTILPISFSAVAEENSLEICDKLLTEYALRYNMEFALNDTIRQFYNTPYVISNFNEIHTGYRSLMSMSGTLQINKTSNPKRIYVEKPITENGTTTNIWEELPVITSNFSYSKQLDPQAFYNQSNMTVSKSRVKTYTLSLVMYDMTNYFQDKALDEVVGTTDTETLFKIKIVWKNGKTITLDYYLKDYSSEQNIGEMPVSSYVLTP